MEKINNILYYIIIMGLFLFFSFYYHSYILFVLFLAMAIFPFFSFVVTKYIANKLEVTVEINNYYCHTHKEYALRLVINNPTAFPVTGCCAGLHIENFYYPNDIFHYINLSVPAFNKQEAVFPVSFEKCGCYTAEIKSFYINDFLNFKKMTVKANAVYQFNVYPVAENYEIMGVTNELSDEEGCTTQKSNTGAQLDGIREYMQGDLLKNIHWKLSAKADELLVKEFNDSPQDSIIILTELYKPVLNSVLNNSFSIACSLLKQGNRVYLCWLNSGNEQLEKAMIVSMEELEQAFGRMFLSYPYEVPALALLALRREYEGQGIIHISGDENDNKAVINIL